MAERTDDPWTTGDRTARGDDPSNRADDPAAIRAEIDETRSRMSDTLDELGERLNPNVVKERVKDTIREATIGRVEHMARNAADKVNDTGRGMADTIRDNPIPAAMVGVGLAWLLLNGRRSDSGHVAKYRYYQGREWDAADEYEEDEELAASGKVERVRERASEIAGTVRSKTREKAGELADRAQQVAGRVNERAHDVAGRVNERAHDVAGSVAEKSRRQARRMEDLFYENPLAIGAVTLAAGFAVGLGAPRTDVEVRLMGDARDQVVDRVRGMAEEKKEQAQHVAERVIEEGKESLKEAARSEGLIRS